MAKFSGNIGFGITTETKPGVFQAKISVKPYRGDIVNQHFQRQSNGNVNDEINITNEISIVADSFAMEHLQFMLFVEYMGAKWKIKSVEVKHPRVILSVGGLYNGKTN